MADNQNAAQAARRRKRRKATQSALSWKTIAAAGSRAPLAAGRAVASFALRHKGATGIVALGLVLAWGTGSGLRALRGWADSTLPVAITVDAPSKALRDSVTRMANAELARVRKAKETRPTLLGRLASELEALDPVDAFELRSGLDAKLQIRVTSQVPLFVLEGQGKERVLIGHRMRLLQRKVGPNDYPHLLRISTPEFRVAQAFPQTKAAAGARGASGAHYAGESDPDKETRQAGVRPDAKSRTLAPMNFAWLAGQGSRIRESLRKQKTPYLLEEISWKASSGFTLRLRDAEGIRADAAVSGADTGTSAGPGPAVATAVGAATPQGNAASGAAASAAATPAPPRAVEITLGESDIEKKISRLPDIFGDIAAKGLAAPAAIDLHYSDKALIRLSESGATTPL